MSTTQVLREYYNETMDLLKAFETGKQGPHCVVVEWVGHPVVQEEIPPVDKALHKDNFTKDTLTAEELEMVAQLTGKSHSSRKPPNAPLKSNSSISPAKSHALQSPPPDSNEPATTCSSPEGSELEQENAATPTPATRSYSQVTRNHKITTPLDNDDDSDEEDEGGRSHNKLSSDSEDDAEQSQAPPKEKSKAKKCSTNLMEKLVTGSGQKKP
ncbi:hypothetical protein FRC11_003078, partial [Ceratobasidium sp. 423]